MLNGQTGTGKTTFIFNATEDPNAKVGEELIVIGIAGRGREQVAARLQGLVPASQARFELGDVGEILGAKPAVDGGELAVGVGRREQVAAGFVQPGRRRPQTNDASVGILADGRRRGRGVDGHRRQL